MKEGGWNTVETSAGKFDSGYDIVTAVMTKHVPVVTGIIALILVIASPYVYELYQRRKNASRKPLEAPDEKDTEPAVGQDDEALKNDRAILTEITSAVEEQIASTKSKTIDKIAALACGISDSSIKGEALMLIGGGYEHSDDMDKAKETYLAVIDLGQRGMASKRTGIGADRLSLIYEKKGDQKQALLYARKALTHFDQTGLDEKVDDTTQRIKKLKSAG